MRPDFQAERRLARRLLLAGLAAGVVILAPLAAFAGSEGGKRSSASGGLSDDRGDRFSWGLFEPSGSWNTMDTDGDDWRELRRLMKEEEQPVFWFRIDGRNYVVRDPAVVARANEMVEPIRELGRKQSVLGDKQGVLGEQQGRLGEQQAVLGAQQAKLGARLSRLAYLAGDEDRAARRERREIEEAMRELGQRQAELGRQQAPIGRIQADLGREQAAMGLEQRRIAKEIGTELRRLAEAAVKGGQAVAIPRTRSI